MKIDILTLFPKMIETPLQTSIIGKSIDNQKLDFNIVDFRKFSENKHSNVDDYPYGGGSGMLLTPQPIFDAVESVQQGSNRGRVILMDPAGEKFDQKMAQDLSLEDHLTFICGHYEGYDERIKTLVTDEISLGDFIMTGGELAALSIIDATVRLIPGILGNENSNKQDSYEDKLLEYPQYTRPENFRGMKVPEVLLSGNHQKIADWRRVESLKKTLKKRPDLLEKNEHLNENDRVIIRSLKDNLDNLKNKVRNE